MQAVSSNVEHALTLLDFCGSLLPEPAYVDG
jgi:hypothetical protein